MTMNNHSVKVTVASLVIILLSLSLLCNGYRYIDLYEGSACDDDGHTCKRMLQCEPASLEYNLTGKTHSYPRCGFVEGDEDDEELVCCPPSQHTRLVDKGPAVMTDHTAVKVNISPAGKRKCVRACEEITTFVNRQVNTNILDGEDASSGDFPHMAALGTSENGTISWRCGGSIISDRYILSAAHCIFHISQIVPTTVRIGGVNISDPGEVDAQEFVIRNITVHPQYNSRRKVNDIALVELVQPIKRSVNVHPACLYTNNDDPTSLVATGWGTTTLNAIIGSEILQKANLTSVPISECNATYIGLKLLESLTIAHFCTGAPPGRSSDPCLGDSGGPLQVENVRNSKVFSIVGIISAGNGCGGKTPGLYTRVSSYLDWIEGIVWPDL